MSDFPLHIDVRSVWELMEGNGEPLLLDCREPDEFGLVRIEGSKHMPMDEIPSRLNELEPFRNQRIVVVCHHGVRSLKITQFLRAQGFRQAQNMMGGIHAWSLVVDTSLPRY